MNQVGQGRQPGGNRFMAQQDALYDNVQGALRQRTHLVQLYIDNPEDGPGAISSQHPSGVPIMAIVNQPSGCF